MKHSRATAVALSATMARLGLTSCSSPLATQTYLPEPAVLQSAVDCSTANGWEVASTQPAALLKGSVPEGFAPDQVATCAMDPATMAVTEEWLSGGFGPLLAALATPSERGGPASCLDYGEILPGIWLVNAAGEAVNAQWPMDSCGHSLPGTYEALKGLTVVSSKTVPGQEAAS